MISPGGGGEAVPDGPDGKRVFRGQNQENHARMAGAWPEKCRWRSAAPAQSYLASCRAQTECGAGLHLAYDNYDNMLPLESI